MSLTEMSRTIQRTVWNDGFHEIGTAQSKQVGKQIVESALTFVEQILLIYRTALAVSQVHCLHCIFIGSITATFSGVFPFA